MAHTTTRTRLADVGTYACYVLVIAFFGGPLLWLLSLSLRLPEEVYSSSLHLLPENPTLANFSSVLESGRFQGYVRNSAVLSVFGTAGALVCALPAAYAASTMRFAGRRFFLIGVLALQMVSPLIIMVPLYRYLASVGLLDSTPITIAVYMATLIPISTWMLRGFFDGIPRDYAESAQVDGCTTFTAFLRIVIPLARSGIAAVAVIAVILAWAEFAIPYILLSDPAQQPLSVGVLSFQGTFGQTSTQILAAAGILSVVPILTVFIILQRQVVGVLSGGLKG